MRKRERWVGMAWVCWVQGDEKDGRCTPLGDYPENIKACLGTLLRAGKRWIEMEETGDEYWVRVLPMVWGGGNGVVDYGLSYWGSDLGKILAQAVRDFDAIHENTRAFSVAKMEAPRWVP